MKNTGRKTVKGSKTSAPMVMKATDARTSTVAVEHVPSTDDIARRSYELFLASGGTHGHDVEHWLQAERDLRAS
jgi:hypothetical protein